MPTTVNYAKKYLNEIFKNFNFLDRTTIISKQQLLLRYELDIDLEDLEMQATIFSENYATHAYINFYKTLKVRQEEVVEALFQAYIYSYTKAVFNAFFAGDISERADMGYCLSGHAALYHLLTRSRANNFSDDLYLSYHIDLGSKAEKLLQISRLLIKFKFLTQHSRSRKDANGTDAFFIPELESYIMVFVQDYYASEHTNTGAGTSPEATKISPKKAVELYGSGMLHLSKLGTNDQNSIINFDNNPVMNAFVCKHTNKLYFAPVRNGKSMEFNDSFSFCKANFICLSKENDFDIINSYFLDFDLSKDLTHLLCSEVYANCGIKCRYVVNNKKKRAKVITIPEILNKMPDDGLSFAYKVYGNIIDRAVNNEKLPDLDDIIESFLMEVKERSEGK